MSSKRIILSVFVIIGLISLSGQVAAQETSGTTDPDLIEPAVNTETTTTARISFPVPELNNCRSQSECKAYCDNPDNIEACVAFAESNGLMSKERAERTRRLAVLKNGGGPGNCSSPEECKNYCSNLNNADECITFAEKHQITKPEKLAEARKIKNALEAGITTPGNCQTKEECRLFCSNPNNIEACINFAEQTGIAPSGDINLMRQKFIPLIKSGQTPGGCTTREECDIYCSNEANKEECADFASKLGKLTPERIELLRKAGPRGPGGCQGELECKEFCSDPANENECINFARKHQIITEERLTKIQESRNQFKEAIQKAPPAVVSCIKNTVDANILSKIEAGEFTPPVELGQKIRNCFESQLPPGPGGCRNQDECQDFCSNNPNSSECLKFRERLETRSEFRQELREEHRDDVENTNLNNQPMPAEIRSEIKRDDMIKKSENTRSLFQPEPKQKIKADIRDGLIREEIKSEMKDMPANKPDLRQGLIIDNREKARIETRKEAFDNKEIPSDKLNNVERNFLKEQENPSSLDPAASIDEPNLEEGSVRDDNAGASILNIIRAFFSSH